jgi:hypothetical protein
MAPRALAVLLVVGCGGDPAAVTARAPEAPHSPPTFEIDHVWIVASPGAPERAAFERAGFQVAGKVNQHVGQGTSSVTVELDNGFLELIYVDEAVPVAAGREVVPVQFKQRAEWRTTGYSPIGIGVRRLAGAPAEFPFPTFKISAEWMEPGTFMEVLSPRSAPAALRLFVPAHASVGPDADPVEPSTRVHRNGTHRLTRLRVVAPSAAQLPPAAQYLADRARMTFEVGSEWLLEVWLDDGAQREQRDLRPMLPAVVYY